MTIHIGNDWVQVSSEYVKLEREYVGQLQDEWDSILNDKPNEELRQQILDKRVECFTLFKKGKLTIPTAPPKISWWKNNWRKLSMDNQHKQIKGYRDLSQEEINLMNDCKAMAEQVGDLVSRIQSQAGIDQRRVAEGKTDLQKGFMSLIRSIAQPTTF